MISRATPFMNPTITEFETKRMRRPRWRKPAISMKIPVRMVSMNRAPGREGLTGNGGDARYHQRHRTGGLHAQEDRTGEDSADGCRQHHGIESKERIDAREHTGGERVGHAHHAEDEAGGQVRAYRPAA